MVICASLVTVDASPEISASLLIRLSQQLWNPVTHRV